MKNKLYVIAIIVVVIFYFGCFWVLFEWNLAGDGTSFIFQVVVALMSTGLLAIITAVMFTFQSQIENKKENKAKIFEKKISFYTEVLSELDGIFANGRDEKSSHKFVFLVSKAMLVASPTAAQSFSDLFVSFEKQEGTEKYFIEFLKAARADLDLIDDLSAGGIDKFEPVLALLKGEIIQETKNLRFWSSEQKSEIIEQYDLQKNNKVKWLRETHQLYPSQIATWRRQLK